jgi:hypothetical protein
VICPSGMTVLPVKPDKGEIDFCRLSSNVELIEALGKHYLDPTTIIYKHSFDECIPHYGCYNQWI